MCAVWEGVDAQLLAFDPAYADSVIPSLEERGVAVCQIPGTAALTSPPINILSERVKDGTIRHDGNPCMTWQIGNLHTDFNKELQRPCKAQTYQEIDGTVALLKAMAAYHSTSNKPKVSDSLVEKVARALCISQKIDPDATGFGMGRGMPKGKTYPIWHAWRRMAAASIEAVGAEVLEE